MNEIERFKKGRMIGKYLAGKPITIGGVTYTPEGNNYYYFTNHRGHRLKNTITAQEFEKIRLTTPTEDTLGGYVREKNRSLFGSGYRWYDASKPNSAVAIDKEIEVGDWIIKPDGTKVHKSTRQQNANGGQPAATQKKGRRFIDTDGSEYWLGSDGSKTLLKKGNTPAAGTTTTLTGGTRGTGSTGGTGATRRTPFVSMIGDLNLTDEEKNFITQAGFDPTNARSLQDFILSKASNANLGARGGVGKSDGYFGQKSFDAFQALRRSGVFTPKVDAQETPAPVVEQPVDAPDFGYRTSNTYESNDFSDRLKNMGIRSNADLIDFMHKTNGENYNWNGDNWAKQFRSDVNRALGGDYSDANIRKTFHTKNGWGGGFLGGGDFADFQNALQTNAGVWNGMYDRKQEEARMDAARQQLAAKRAQQYTEQNPVKLKPLQIPAGMNINHGPMYYKSPVAASTLGDAGAGTMNPSDDWMQFAAQSGYLPQQ